MLQGEEIIGVMFRALVINAVFIGVPARESWVGGARGANGCIIPSVKLVGMKKEVHRSTTRLSFGKTKLS